MKKLITSIIIPSFTSIKHLEKCLQSLQPLPDDAEIIVSTIFTADETKTLQKKYKATYIYNPEERNLNSVQLRETRVFRLRARAIRSAQGKIIAIIEDHCEAEPQWLKEMQMTLSDCNCIAGGSVVNGLDSGLYSWALYWSEYAAMMPPFPKKGLTNVSAVNSAYHKTALDACKKVWQDGFFDNEVHTAMLLQGAKFCPAPRAIVLTSLPFSFRQAFVHLYTGGQHYGGYRGGKYWSMERLIRLFSTVLVPAVLYIRIFKLVLKRQPKNIFTFFLSSPILYLLLSAWGFGELSGTFSGRDEE